MLGEAAVATLTTLAAGALAYHFAVARRSQTAGRYARLREVPGPRGWPVIGSLPLLIRRVGLEHRVDLLVAELHRAYGALVKVEVLFGRVLLFTNDADVAKRVLNDNKTFVRTLVFQSAVSAAGKYGLLQLEGPVWKKHRKLLQPAFGPVQLKAAVDVVNREADKLFAYWDELITDNKSLINFHTHITAATLDVIGHISFSHSFNALASLKNPDINTDAMKAADTLFSMVTLRVSLPPFIRPLFGVGDAAAKPHLAIIHAVLKKSLDAKLAARRTGGKEEPSGDESNSKWEREKKMDFLDRLLENAGAGEDQFSEQEILDEVTTMYFAGHETTSNSMTWILLELCRNPAVLAKAVAEVDRVLGASNEPLWEDLTNLTYIEKVIKETLRLNPVAPVIVREVMEETEVAGYLLPKHLRINCVALAIHRNPKYWRDPDTFDPDRFLETPYSGSFFPFGDGPRNCIGQRLAMIELKMFTARMLQRYTFELLAGQPLVPVSTVTMGLKNGLFVTVKRRAK